MITELEGLFRPGAEELVALDSMAVSLQATQRHRCKKLTQTAAGGAVLWAFCVRGARGICPVKILRFVQGPWKDSQLLMQVDLIAKGPIYLMDRGFLAIALITRLLGNQVRFILRATFQDLTFDVLRTVGQARQTPSGIRIKTDAVVILGSRRRAIRPQVRLVYAYTKTGKDLILISDRLDWSAERLLEAYRARWQIERFHRFLKESVGLAHLYSFQQRGLEFLVHTALLLTLLLFLSTRHSNGFCVDILYAALRNLRKSLGLLGIWRRNTPGWRKRTSKGRRKKTKPLNDTGRSPRLV